MRAGTGSCPNSVDSDKKVIFFHLFIPLFFIKSKARTDAAACGHTLRACTKYIIIIKSGFCQCLFAQKRLFFRSSADFFTRFPVYSVEKSVDIVEIQWYYINCIRASFFGWLNINSSSGGFFTFWNDHIIVIREIKRYAA